MKTETNKALLIFKMFMCYVAFWVLSVSAQMLELYLYWSN